MTPLLPFVRWAGGKRWLAERLAAEVAESGATLYVEPFLGGGAVALAVDVEKQILSDTSRALINTWRMIEAYPTATARAAQAMMASHDTEAGYGDVRYLLNANTPFGIEQAARFLFLNATSFNGLWRENATGYFNVPYGDGKRTSILTEDDALALSARLRGADILYDDFRVTLGVCREGAAVFVDPPYDGTFTTYGAGGFPADDQRALARACYDAWQRGANIWATNADTPLVRDLWAWCDLEEVEEPRRVAARGDADKTAPCLLMRSPP